VGRSADVLPEGRPDAFNAAPTTAPSADGLTVGQWLSTNFPSLHGEDGTSLQGLSGLGLGDDVFDVAAADLKDPGRSVSTGLFAAAALTTFAVLKATDEKKRASRVEALDGALQELYG
jgi:hypothetical protein